MKHPNVDRLEALADTIFGSYPHSVERVIGDMYEVRAYVPGFFYGCVYRIYADALHAAGDGKFAVIAQDLAELAMGLDERNPNGPFYTSIRRVIDDTAKALAKVTTPWWSMKVEDDWGGAKQW